MRDVQTERKEALFIIFVAPRLFSDPRERTRGHESSERKEEAGRLLVQGLRTKEAGASCPALECKIASLSRVSSVHVVHEYTRSWGCYARARVRSGAQ